MYILSGTLFSIIGLLLLLSGFIWRYFFYYWYSTLILFSLVFLMIGCVFYYIGYKESKVSK